MIDIVAQNQFQEILVDPNSIKKKLHKLQKKLLNKCYYH